MDQRYKGKGVAFPAVQLDSKFNPFPLIRDAPSSLSLNPASTYFQPFDLPNNLAVGYVNVIASLNAAVPAATSENSSGTQIHSYRRDALVFKRVDFGSSSTQLTFVASGSIGLTAAYTWSSGSQSLALSWVTNSTGGVSSVSTTSSDGGWSSSLTGPKLLQIPFVTTLLAGHYMIAHANSSTTAKTGSNFGLLSISAHQIGASNAMTFGTLGGTATQNSFGFQGHGVGPASAITTNATMAATVISASSPTPMIWNMSYA